ncbi:MAG TPA: two-component regulator propeller domain-containing protein [Cyclobacteriaceae bacterium]|nr:two-component regulator propeller domain-containing protein [Cyclobacteriaceae bacterium]
MRTLLSVGCLLVCMICVAQRTIVKNDYLFSQLTTKEGLSINETSCVFQDSRGFIWIGTTDGLNLYTGNNIIVFRSDPKDSLSLPDNLVQAIAEDKDHHLWIATSGGLTRMNLNSWKIEKVFRQNENPGSIANTVVLYIDRQDRLWTANIGLDLYDPSCDCFQHFVNRCHTDESEFRSSNLIHSLYLDSAERMWVGTQYGMYQFNLNTKSFSVVDWFPRDNKKGFLGPIVAQIMEDHNHQLWAGTWGSGLIKFFPDEKKLDINSIKIPQDQKITIYNVVDHLAESKTRDGRYHLWTLSDGGFGEWDDANRNFILHQYDPANKIAVKSVYSDHSGIVWICTASNGVHILDPYRQNFKTTFFDSKVSAPAPAFGAINCILSEGDTIWMATWYGNVLYKFDRNFNLLKKWNRIPENSSVDESGQGNDVFRDKKGYLWISTLHGLHRLDTKTNSIRSFYHNPHDSTTLPSNRVVKYFEDSEGIGWVCFYKKGISKFDPSTGKCYDYVRGPESGGGQIYNFNVWDILEDDDHNVLFADDGLGLWKYNRKQKKLTAPKDKVTRGHIASMVKKEDAIWIATNGGLIKSKGDSTQRIEASNGLPSNSVLGVQIDNQRRLWIAMNKGLARDDQKGNMRLFKEEDGLEKMGEVIFEKLSDGRMVIGAWNFITVFDPAKITSNENVPEIHLTQFKVFGKPVAWSENASGKSVTIEYAQNQFSFDFAVLNYSNPGGNKFYYKMDGFNKEWVNATQGFANYTNLNPGSYIFRVKGANGDGVMNETGDFILIKIIPPFWATWWFMVLCMLAAGSIIYVFYRIRLAQMLRLERLRAKISTDLHDDMGSTLSSISILSDMALKANESTKHSMLAEIKDNSITLMERMDDIVWSINPRNDSFDRLMVRVQNFASKLFEAKGIDYQIEVPESVSHVRLSMDHRQHVYLIMKEAVNNLVKYSESKFASIKVSVSPLTVEITDKGKGFDVSKPFQGNGIQSMRSRAKMMKAELQIQSTQGVGSTVLLKIK